jgi:putative Holliday junction resolvase
MPPSLPAKGRLLGLDFGTRRIGLALSNPEQSLATPLATWTRRDSAQEARAFRRAVEDYQVVALVIGLPLHTTGSEGRLARQAREFGRWLASVLNLPVEYCDERFTTALADDALRSAGLRHSQRRGRRDTLAAQIMLQSYLDARQPDGGRAPPEPLPPEQQ